MFDQEHYDNLLKGVPHWTEYVQRQDIGFRAQLQYARLSGANLEKATLLYADLRDAALKNANLSSAFLNDANLAFADLSEATLKGTVFIKANLRLVSLVYADLRGATLARANLTDASLVGADLTDADFGAATVDGACVETVTSGPVFEAEGPRFTNLSGVKNLTQEQLNKMKGDSGTILPAGLARPAHWPSLPGLLNGQQVEDTPPIKFKEAPAGVLGKPDPRIKYPGITNLSNPTSDTTPVNPGLPGPETQPDPDRFVFLSYKREDRAWVATLRGTLIDRGIPIWWDDDIPYDQNWDDEIDAHLEAAEIVLIAWTDKSTASREVKNEALYAIRNNKLVQVQTGHPKLGPRYEAIQCADLSDWSPAQSHPDFDRLVDTLRRRLEA